MIRKRIVRGGDDSSANRDGSTLLGDDNSGNVTASRLRTDGGKTAVEITDREEDEQTDGESTEEGASDGESADGDDEPTADSFDGEYHVEDADDIYEGRESSGLVHLDVDGVFLDLLGLEVNLNPVTLDVSARPGESNLLGNLLSAVTGLLNGPKALVQKAKSLLSKPREWLGRAIGAAKSAARRVIEKPKSMVGGLVPGGDERADDEQDDEGSASDQSEGIVRSAVGRLKSGLAGLVPELPIERIVGTVVRTVLEQAIDRLASDEGETLEQAGTETAEA